MNWNLQLNHGPIRTSVNNGTAYSRGGMPLKDNTSENENHFSLNRHTYVHTNDTYVANTQSIKEEKKWIANSNRDASAIYSRLKSKEIGYTSKNPNHKEYSFTSFDKNAINQAKLRTRNKGYVVPPKVVKNTNAPIFY
jgi:uncharacterized membrane protein